MLAGQRVVGLQETPDSLQGEPGLKGQRTRRNKAQMPVEGQDQVSNLGAPGALSSLPAWGLHLLAVPPQRWATLG